MSEILKQELLTALEYKPVHKDILMVVHNQLDYVKHAIESVQRNTRDFTLYVWDNASDEETRKYLNSIDAKVTRSEDNLGFIVPNNRLAEQTNSPYIILLNSDTRVYPNWDKTMLAWQQVNQVAQVGYLGGYLNKKGKGIRFGPGYNVDYISGFCFSISRETYEKYGLFDEINLEFAYCEDSDYSMRLREAGERIYALTAKLVHHYENKTIVQVLKETDLTASLKKNSSYLLERWGKWLGRAEIKSILT
jgi:GT2 family glycosyltransferase